MMSSQTWVSFSSQPCGEFCGWFSPCAVSRSTTICPHSSLRRANDVPSFPVYRPTAKASGGFGLRLYAPCRGREEEEEVRWWWWWRWWWW